jgi:hypothetical protein
MRIATISAVMLMSLVVPATGQMTHTPGQSPTTGQSTGGMMMCGMGTTGQGQQSQEKTDKPMQMGMMCPCCQAMMKKGMMQKMQKMPMQKTPDIEEPKVNGQME